MEEYIQPATDAQVRSIEDFYNTELDFQMSANQANTLLSIRDYVRAVADIVRAEGMRVSEDHMRLVAGWVINDPKLPDELAKWNAGRFQRGTHNETPRLRRSSEIFRQIHGKMKSVAR